MVLLKDLVVDLMDILGATVAEVDQADECDGLVRILNVAELLLNLDHIIIKHILESHIFL